MGGHHSSGRKPPAAATTTTTTTTARTATRSGLNSVRACFCSAEGVPGRLSCGPGSMDDPNNTTTPMHTTGANNNNTRGALPLGCGGRCGRPLPRMGNARVKLVHGEAYKAMECGNPGKKKKKKRQTGGERPTTDRPRTQCRTWHRRSTRSFAGFKVCLCDFFVNFVLFLHHTRHTRCIAAVEHADLCVWWKCGTPPHRVPPTALCTSQYHFHSLPRCGGVSSHSAPPIAWRRLTMSATGSSSSGQRTRWATP